MPISSWNHWHQNKDGCVDQIMLELPVRFMEQFPLSGPVYLRFGLISSVNFDIMTMYSVLSYVPWFPTFFDFGLFLSQDNVLLRHTVL